MLENLEEAITVPWVHEQLLCETRSIFVCLFALKTIFRIFFKLYLIPWD